MGRTANEIAHHAGGRRLLGVLAFRGRPPRRGEGLTRGSSARGLAAKPKGDEADKTRPTRSRAWFGKDTRTTLEGGAPRSDGLRGRWRSSRRGSRSRRRVVASTERQPVADRIEQTSLRGHRPPAEGAAMRWASYEVPAGGSEGSSDREARAATSGGYTPPTPTAWSVFRSHPRGKLTQQPGEEQESSTARPRLRGPTVTDPGQGRHPGLRHGLPGRRGATRSSSRPSRQPDRPGDMRRHRRHFLSPGTPPEKSGTPAEHRVRGQPLRPLPRFLLERSSPRSRSRSTSPRTRRGEPKVRGHQSAGYLSGRSAWERPKSPQGLSWVGEHSRISPAARP